MVRTLWDLPCLIIDGHGRCLGLNPLGRIWFPSDLDPACRIYGSVYPAGADVEGPPCGIVPEQDRPGGFQFGGDIIEDHVIFLDHSSPSLSRPITVTAAAVVVAVL